MRLSSTDGFSGDSVQDGSIKAVLGLSKLENLEALMDVSGTLWDEKLGQARCLVLKTAALSLRWRKELFTCSETMPMFQILMVLSIPEDIN